MKTETSRGERSISLHECIHRCIADSQHTLRYSLREPFHFADLVVDLHFELPTMSWREIAEICYIRYGRRPDHKSIKHIATSGRKPSLRERRYQPLHLIANPVERRLAVIRLHSEG